MKRALRLARHACPAQRPSCLPPCFSSLSPMTAGRARHKQTTAAAPADFSSLLSAHQREVLAQERTVMLSLHESLLAMGTDPKELLVLRDVINQMEELFMVCVVGEFNAGKPSFVNALLGGRHVEEGVLPTTAQVAVLRFGERESRAPSLDASGLPVEVRARARAAYKLLR